MSGAFDQQFKGDGRARIKGEIDPGIVAACSDQPAEAAVVGALLRDSSLVDQAADDLRPEEFSDIVLGEVYGAIVAMHGAGETAAPITVARRLAHSTDLTERGAAKYLATLAAADTIDRGLGYIAHLVDLSRRRYLLQGMGELRPNVASTAAPLETTIGDIEGVLSNALFWTASRPAMAMADAWDAAMREIDAIAAGEKDLGTIIPCFVEWNEVCGGGMMAGQLILLGGRPGMGKTAVALSVARRTAEAGHGVLFISREMPVAQLMMRLIADMLFEAGSHATFNDVLHGRLNDRDRALAAAIRQRLDRCPLMFEEPASLNAARVGSIIRRHQRQFAQRGQALKLVVVDYLGLLDPPLKRSNREQEMGDVSREMKNVARATGVTMLALAQLNRGVEQREDKRPLLSDLRDSGSLEQDADTVVFAYRAEYYLRQAEPDVNDIKKRDAWEIEMGAARDGLDIYSAKVRQGEPQRRKIHFFGGRQAVRSADYHRTSGGNQGWAS